MIYLKIVSDLQNLNNIFLVESNKNNSVKVEKVRNQFTKERSISAKVKTVTPKKVVVTPKKVVVTPKGSSNT